MVSQKPRITTLPTALVTPNGERYDCIAQFHHDRAGQRWSGYIVHKGVYLTDLGFFDNIQEVEEAGIKATGGSNKILVPHVETLDSPGEEKIDG